jgi:hypothetical protein
MARILTSLPGTACFEWHRCTSFLHPLRTATGVLVSFILLDRYFLALSLFLFIPILYPPPPLLTCLFISSIPFLSFPHPLCQMHTKQTKTVAVFQAFGISIDRVERNLWLDHVF